uniref:Uncharacterized protein n=1 Tax=Romanomermis culicivorax TaxID=13658 RepID=A0A915JXT2_ROMCU
ATPASRLAPPPASQNCKNYATTSSKNRQNAGASKQQRLNGFSAQKRKICFKFNYENLIQIKVLT